jgi:hypothetical protein
MNGDNAAALTFLKKVYPDGPWPLTAIKPDKKGIQTRTFYPATEAECLKWLEQYNGKWNLYWLINPPMRDIDKKADREDIKEVAYLHVDIDPREREDLTEERERIYGLLTGRLPEGVPPPNFIIDSGGGYWGFWDPEPTIPVDGDLAKAEDAKLYNLKLEQLFGCADSCHNIDRIARLPGSVNIPDANKLKKGRKEAVAKVLWAAHNAYPLSTFVKAADPNKVLTPYVPTVEVDTGAVLLFDDLGAELAKYNVDTRVLVIINEGHDPDNPKESDNSRSQWVFDMCCQLLRAGVPDQVIFSILMNPAYKISESILGTRGNIEKYALRQIERAKQEIEEPWLRELNDQYAVIKNLGGKCRVVQEIMDPTLKRSRLTRISFEDFRNSYLNETVQVGEDPKTKLPKFEKVGKWWLEHKERRQYTHLVFSPGKEVPGAYNLWKGFAYEARPGDCSLYLDHVQRNICANDPDIYAYLLGWMARAVQKPASQGHVAIVMKGLKGTGKSFFADHFGKLFGRHYLPVSNPGHLVGNFNAHLRDAVVVFADEAFYAGNRAHNSILKAMITQDTLIIEGKGLDAELGPNFTHVIMASNDTRVIAASVDERRFLVLDVSREKMQNKAYFRAIEEQLENGGYEALLHHLLNLDISKFEVRDVPSTAALTDQKLRGLRGIERLAYHIANTGELPAPVTDQERLLRERGGTNTDAAIAFAKRAWAEELNDTEVGLMYGHLGFTYKKHPTRHWRPPDTVKQMRDGFAENYGDLPWTNEFNDTDEVSLGLVPAYRAWEADVPF